MFFSSLTFFLAFMTLIFASFSINSTLSMVFSMSVQQQGGNLEIIKDTNRCSHLFIQIIISFLLASDSSRSVITNVILPSAADHRLSLPWALFSHLSPHQQSQYGLLFVQVVSYLLVNCFFKYGGKNCLYSCVWKCFNEYICWWFTIICVAVEWCFTGHFGGLFAWGIIVGGRIVWPFSFLFSTGSSPLLFILGSTISPSIVFQMVLSSLTCPISNRVGMA